MTELEEKTLKAYDLSSEIQDLLATAALPVQVGALIGALEAVHEKAPRPGRLSTALVISLLLKKWIENEKKRGEEDV